jgi:GxxExxY protein
MAELLYKDLSYAVVGAAMEVHRQLGPGYLEKVYHNALVHEYGLRGIAFEAWRKLPVQYKGVVVGDYEVDFVVAELIVVEIKAVSGFHPRHEAQAISYLTATGLRLALLLNFGTNSLEQKRIVR